MCGIYGLLSPRPSDESPEFDAFFRQADDLLAYGLGDAELDDNALELLETVRIAAYRFVERDGFIEVLSDDGLRARLDRTRGRIEEWIRALEKISESARLGGQTEIERLNRLVVGGRDLAWQLERDVLGNVEPIRALRETNAGSTSRAVWAHLWGLNLVLNNIDRLEVRGRDSAGLGVFVHFRDSYSCEEFLHEEGTTRLEPNPSAGRSITRPTTNESCLLFSYKIANEVGEMGDNVRSLRRLIAGDAAFQRAIHQKAVDVQVLAHTRWASNGIVSIPNCHPVDSTIYHADDPLRDSPGSIVAVLNGDIDNYQELYKEYIVDAGLRIDETITTDAKIIPIVLGHHYRETRDLETAFRLAFDAFEGSMAIGVMAADRPGEFLFGQKGSGQGLYFGIGETSTAIASEMYGLVELTQSYVKAEGEQVHDGEVFHVRRSEDRVGISLLGRDGTRPLDESRVRRAEITTRDINRGDFRHFFLKEISESVETVRKTIRGKYGVGARGDVEFHLGDTVLSPEKLEAFRQGRFRRIITIGQGTAAIAGEGIAHLLDHALSRSTVGFRIQAMKATELSGHHLRADMSDTLVVAVSQSGTTTDTNRTVDMAKERGAWIVGIVNRRNSDLVYKSHGVLYTSDGRDIEMSVASTKAFYAQNVAGQILALALANALGSVPPSEIARELRALNALPDLMRRTLALGAEVRDIASRVSGRRKHWAIVGSGFQKIAADEIRIKLSELCYKSIACDYTEDKKHIDLSSEPFVIACATGASKTTISDVVKEIAIFKAHQSLPIVIADEGESRFDPYAEGVIKVPAYDGALNFLLTTMVGHLFGYHAASTFDSFADRLRAIRTSILADLREAESRDPVEATDMPMSNELIERTREFEFLLADGELDGCVTPSTAIGLARAFNALLGTSVSPTAIGIESALAVVSDAINELARPIDAIKHQAKTVTVGISRSEEAVDEGVVIETLRALDLDVAGLSDGHRRFLAAFGPLVASIDGSTLYEIENLDALGRPRPETTIRAVAKSGCAERMYSRCDAGASLAGTKWGVVKSRELYLGLGQTDQRKILIVPFVSESQKGALALVHLALDPAATPAQRLEALAVHQPRLESLRIAVTERNQEWSPSLLESLDSETLFFGDPDRIAECVTANSVSPG